MTDIGRRHYQGVGGKLFDPVPRQGKRQMRVFTLERVEVLRKAFRENA